MYFNECTCASSHVQEDTKEAREMQSTDGLASGSRRRLGFPDVVFLQFARVCIPPSREDKSAICVNMHENAARNV